VSAARASWFEQFADVRLDRLVFLDEFGAATNMTRRYARGPSGQRVAGTVPHGDWTLVSTIAAMTLRGVVASASFEGATDTDTFVAFVREALVPALEPGQVVVLDNLSVHKAPVAAALVEAAGCRLLPLPPYSPDYNPIEMAISKVKALLRSMAARQTEALLDAIGVALASVTPRDARNFIRHCGYDATVQCKTL